jgi:hypothetical protein
MTSRRVPTRWLCLVAGIAMRTDECKVAVSPTHRDPHDLERKQMLRSPIHDVQLAGVVVSSQRCTTETTLVLRSPTVAGGGEGCRPPG